MRDVPRTKRGHLSPSHPVAEPARRRCRALHPGAVGGIGGVACGRCWEEAIRADERAVVLFGLPREVQPDPTYVDEVAVRRACAGERVKLTPAERAAAVAVLAGRGWLPSRVGEHLGVAAARVRLLWPREARRSAPDGGEAA